MKHKTKGFSKKHETLGFTLVELLVVISIIAILSVIGITVFSSAQKSARDARRRGDLRAIAMALEQYKTTNGNYPAANDIWLISSTTQPWIPSLSPTYIASVPVDPNNTGGSSAQTNSSNGFTYAYYNGPYWATVATGASWYMLVAHLENPNSNDLLTKCTTPNGLGSGGSTNSGATWIYPNTFILCNQQ